MNDYIKNRISKHEAYVQLLEDRRKNYRTEPEAYNKITMEILIVRIQITECAIIQNQLINQNRAQR